MKKKPWLMLTTPKAKVVQLDKLRGSRKMAEKDMFGFSR